YADEIDGPCGPSLAGFDQQVRELTSEGTESIDEVPEPRDGIAYPSAKGGGVILYVSTDAGEPLGRLVGCELTGPYPSQVAEALAGILKERGKRLGVPSHDGFDTGLQAREQPLACALLDFGDLSLELVGVFDPRDGRFTDGVLLGPPFLDGLLLRVGQILLRDRKGFLSFLVLLCRILEPCEGEQERGQAGGRAWPERGNAAEAGNHSTEGRHGGGADEGDGGQDGVEDAERLSGLRHRDGGVLDPPVQSAHPRLGEIDVAREVDQAIPVDVDSDVNVLVIERLGGRGDRSDLRQRLTLGDVDADPLVADGLEGGVDGRDIVVDTLGVDADLNVFGLLAEGGE